MAWVEILAWVDGWRGYLFCLTCKNNKKNYERAESEEAKKNIKNNIQWQKEFVRVHSFMASAKSLKFEP